MPEDEKDQKKTCFIIMPITTPDHMLDRYGDGLDHFDHVLRCLFIPAVEKADYRPIPPIAEGADYIPAEIVTNLGTADLVLCDMSCLNPNVFFEFGARTALNKPVCIVRDELTTKIPFDTSQLNHHPYSSAVEAWELAKQIDALTQHIITSAKRCDGENPLWRQFGIQSHAVPYPGATGPESKLDLMLSQIDALREQVRGLPGKTFTELPRKDAPIKPGARFVYMLLRALLPPDLLVQYRGVMIMDDQECILRFGQAIPPAFRESIETALLRSGLARIRWETGRHLSRDKAE